MGNIFEKLASEITDVEKQTKGIRQLAEHGMCARLLCLYFGWDWYERKVAFRDDPDGWMHNLKDDPGLGRVVYNSRVVRLADAIFTLLNGRFKGAEDLKQRFLTRPTKPCFAEAEIASLLAYNGFDVEVVTPTGVRGQDYDLAATRDGTTVSIEVTTKEDGPLTVETISNTLDSKRTQVPADRPAILYMRIPPEWMRSRRTGQAVFTQAFVDFFKSSRRFNAVILFWEDVVPFASRAGGWTGMTVWGCYNNSPRSPYARMNLLEPITAPDGRVLLAHSFFDWLKKLEAKLQKNPGTGS